MKTIGILSATMAAASVGVFADITLLEPWANTTWSPGEQGTIRWSSASSDNNQLCDIQLMNGNSSDGQLVAFVTDPQAPVPCSSQTYKISALNDFSEGSYWIRIGKKDHWAYSHQFRFQGAGKLDTHQLNEPLPISPTQQKVSAGPTNTGKVPSITHSVSTSTSSHASATHLSSVSTRLSSATTDIANARASHRPTHAGEESMKASTAARGFILSDLWIAVTAVVLQQMLH